MSEIIGAKMAAKVTAGGGVTPKKAVIKISSFREAGLLAFIIVLGAAFQFRNGAFLTAQNLSQMLANTAILGILACGMMLVLLTGGIDLSIGASMAFCGMVSALTCAAYPSIPPIVLVLEATLIGAALGLVNGCLVARFRILPIIASLGLMNIIRGLTYMVSRGAWVSAYQMTDSFKAIATGSVFGLNNLVVVALIIYIAFYFFAAHTREGRRVYAVGSNPEGASVAGLPVKRIVTFVYAAMGALSGLAGVLWVAKFASAQGDTAQGYEMNVIAACVLGGVSVSGGRGKVSGLVLGVLLFGMLANALPLINVSPFWQQFIQGAVILAAIITNVLIKRRSDSIAIKRRAH